jgi:hypothetical protein
MLRCSNKFLRLVEKRQVLLAILIVRRSSTRISDEVIGG